MIASGEGARHIVSATPASERVPSGPMGKGTSAVWSRSGGARTAAVAEAPEQASARTGEQAAMDERAASGGLPSNDPAPASAKGQHGATSQHRDDPASQAPARGSPSALKNW